mgnify:CR=1 FL=1
MKAVVVQLPNANRDSLCFLFLHFYRILESSTVVKLSADDLSAVFAPMIVGSSRAKNSTIRLSISGDSRRESEKQITVMKAFFKLSRRFWEGLLKDPDFCPFGEFLPLPVVINCLTFFYNRNYSKFQSKLHSIEVKH